MISFPIHHETTMIFVYMIISRAIASLPIVLVTKHPSSIAIITIAYMCCLERATHTAQRGLCGLVGGLGGVFGAIIIVTTSVTTSRRCSRHKPLQRLWALLVRGVSDALGQGQQIVFFPFAC